MSANATVKNDVLSAGGYSGGIALEYRDAELLTSLESIGDLVSKAMDRQDLPGRNRNVRLSVNCHGQPLELMCKCFGPQWAVKDRFDSIKGSKARRSWLNALALARNRVGTPAPVGFLERWHNGRLQESYYLAEFQDDVTTFKDELVRLFSDKPECERFMSLMQCVADTVRGMHTFGFQHNDLGNQNILLRRKGASEWQDVQFVDLNRARVRHRLSLRQRARDISRISLPSDLLRVFKEMYFGNVVPPDDFEEWEQFYRMRYAWHSVTRKYRHPLRLLRARQTKRPMDVDYPSEKDMWIWDERSAQAISVMKPRDRMRYYPLSQQIRIGLTTLGRLIPVWKKYRALLAQCYMNAVPIRNRAGVAVNPRPETWARESALLEQLGVVPVFIRFYCHESEREWDFLGKVVDSLHSRGHAVSIGLVQDRAAVNDPCRWSSFVSRILDNVNGRVDQVEVCHAINRVKWGIWSLDEHFRLLQAVAELRGKHPEVKFMGPAVIDFEYPFLVAALGNMPDSFRFSALSHHLYVDRRGAPENRQGRFSSLEKFALARAIAATMDGCDDRLVVSEVNWPLKDTGVYSPVTSPYESSGERYNDPSVDEDDYADYMVRYLLTAICSGMVDRVYWWRLVSRGFGLVDDTDPDNWRERPAYEALKYFLSILDGHTFVPTHGNHRGAGVRSHVFERPDGRRVCVAYSPAGEKEFKVPFDCAKATDSLGNSLDGADCRTGGKMRVGGRPVYFVGSGPASTSS
jgi:hypothetical protein